MKIQNISEKNLEKYEKLFDICFKKNKLKKDYLEWLYFRNPLGEVVGYDALENGRVVAHFACIPTKIDGDLGLLCVNNATHPDFRSQGLHEKLAHRTFGTAGRKYSFIVAVLNYYSVRNYVKKLGFREIGRLELRFGKLNRNESGLRKWSVEEISWRLNSPQTKFKLKERKDGKFIVNCYPKKFPLILKSQVFIHNKLNISNFNYLPSIYGLTIDWNRNRRALLFLPQKFKPSPLILVIKNLKRKRVRLNSFSFLDFDAF